MPPREGSPPREHADRMRTALLDAAMQLFATQGYDNTTTDEVAELAGVSPRTFFRYFPNKESVLFSGEYDFISAFSGVYLAQDDALSDYDAMVMSFALLAPGLKRIRRRIGQYYAAVASSAVLLGRERHNHDANGATVARVVAARRGLSAPDAECELLAAVGLLLLERATKHWLVDASTALDDCIRDEFLMLPGLVAARH